MTNELNMTTHDLIKRLRNLGPLGKIMEELVIVAADRLEELQWENDTNDPYMWRKHWDEAIQQRDEARAEVERLQNWNNSQAKIIENERAGRYRPEPSRLEIAAMAMQGMLAASSFDTLRLSRSALEAADALIGAANEAK